MTYRLCAMLLLGSLLIGAPSSRGGEAGREANDAESLPPGFERRESPALTFRCRSRLIGRGGNFLNSSILCLDAAVEQFDGGRRGRMRGDLYQVDDAGNRYENRDRVIDVSWDEAEYVQAVGPGRVLIVREVTDADHVYFGTAALGGYVDGWIHGLEGWNLFLLPQEPSAQCGRRDSWFVCDTRYGRARWRYRDANDVVPSEWELEKSGDHRHGTTTVAEDHAPGQPAAVGVRYHCRVEAWSEIDDGTTRRGIPQRYSLTTTITTEDGAVHALVVETTREEVGLADDREEPAREMEPLIRQGVSVRDTGAPLFEFTPDAEGRLTPVVPKDELAVWRSSISAVRRHQGSPERHDPAQFERSCQLTGGGLCGLFCVDGIAQLAGSDSAGDTFRDLMNVRYLSTDSGSSVAELRRALDEVMGLSSSVQRYASLDDLTPSELPVVAHVRRFRADRWPNHFIIIQARDGDSFNVLDPDHLAPQGRPYRTWAREDLAWSWDGVAIRIEEENHGAP